MRAKNLPITVSGCFAGQDQLSYFYMPKIGLTREQIHKRIYSLGILSTSTQRQAVTDCIVDLSHSDRWSPNAFREALKELEAQGEISKQKRYRLQQELFPDHSWPSA